MFTPLPQALDQNIRTRTIRTRNRNAAPFSSSSPGVWHLGKRTCKLVARILFRQRMCSFAASLRLYAYTINLVAVWTIVVTGPSVCMIPEGEGVSPRGWRKAHEASKVETNLLIDVWFARGTFENGYGFDGPEHMSSLIGTQEYRAPLAVMFSHLMKFVHQISDISYQESPPISRLSF